MQFIGPFYLITDNYSDEHIYNDIYVDDLLRKNQSIFATNLARFKVLNSTANDKQESGSLEQFFTTLSYKGLYIFNKQVLSLDTPQEQRDYSKLITQGFADKLFHEIKLDDYLPNEILQNILFPYFNERDVHDIAFMGQVGEE